MNQKKKKSDKSPPKKMGVSRGKTIFQPIYYHTTGNRGVMAPGLLETKTFSLASVI